MNMSAIERNRFSFNRTSMESKHCLPIYIHILINPFNRTSMESKQRSVKDAFYCFHAFNRTSMESKRRTETQDTP